VRGRRRREEREKGCWWRGGEQREGS